MEDVTVKCPFVPWGSVGSIAQVEKELKAGQILARPVNFNSDSIGLQYKAKVKLHGANSSVVIHNSFDGLEVKYQSRNKILDPNAGGRSGTCFGFATWAKKHESFFLSVAEKWSPHNASISPRLPSYIAIFGEWCGSSVQKGPIALAKLKTQIFVVFSIQLAWCQELNKTQSYLVTEPKDIAAMLGVEWDSSNDRIASSSSRPEQLYIIPWYVDSRLQNNQGHFSFSIGDRSTKVSDNRNLAELITKDIDKLDPWVLKTFDVEGGGEGLVWYPWVDPEKTLSFLRDLAFPFWVPPRNPYDKPKNKIRKNKKRNKDAKSQVKLPKGFLSRLIIAESFFALAFKTKGPSHCMVATIPTKSLSQAQDFVSAFLTKARVDQGWTEVFRSTRDTISLSDAEDQDSVKGDFVEWMASDIFKESEIEREKFKLTWGSVDPIIRAEAAEISERLYQQEMKETQEELGTFFGLQFCFSESIPIVFKNKISSLIKSAGGEVLYSINKQKCTHLVAATKDWLQKTSRLQAVLQHNKLFAEQLDKAKKSVSEGKRGYQKSVSSRIQPINIVNLKFILDSLASQSVLPVESYSPTSLSVEDEKDILFPTKSKTLSSPTPLNSHPNINNVEEGSTLFDSNESWDIDIKSFFSSLEGEDENEETIEEVETVNEVAEPVRFTEEKMEEISNSQQTEPEDIESSSEPEELQNPVPEIDEMKQYYLDVPSQVKKSLPAVTTWNEKDSKQPKYSENFEVIRVDVLQCVDFDHNANKYYFLELQESSSPGLRYPYRILTNNGRTDEISSAKKSARNYRYCITLQEVLYRYYSIINNKQDEGYFLVQLSSISNHLGSGKAAGRRTTSVSRKDTRSASKNESKVEPTSEVERLVAFFYQSANDILKQLFDVTLTAKGLETPLGSLALDQIDRGQALLDKMRKVLEGPELLHPAKLPKLCSQYFSTIPHRLGKRKAEVQQYIISDMKALEEKESQLQIMRDVISLCEERQKALVGDSLMSEERLRYEALRCSIISLQEESPEWLQAESILRTPHKSKEAIHAFTIRDVYKISRQEEETRYIGGSIGNEQYLVHCSRTPNFAGLLSRGMLLPKSVVNLQMAKRTDFGYLGFGLYFSNNLQASIKYSSDPIGGMGERSNSRFALIAKVALGKPMQCTRINATLTAPPKGYDSCLGVAQTESTPSAFIEDEFVVYDLKQVKLVYLIEFTL